MSKTQQNLSDISGSLRQEKASLWAKIGGWLASFKWPLIVCFWIGAFAFGYLGFKEHFIALGLERSPWDIFYLTFQLFTLESGAVSGHVGWKLQLARFLAPTAVGYTAFQALAIIFHEQFQALRLHFMKNHVVICGLGRKGLLLAQSFLKKGKRVVVIELDEANPFIRRCKESGAVVLIGNAADKGVLRRAQVHKAEHLIVVCSDEGINAEVAVKTRDMVWNRRGNPLPCYAHIGDNELCKLLREHEMSIGRLDAFRLEFFNVFENGAKLLLKEYPAFDPRENVDNARPHIVVIGVGCMGEALVVNAARAWYNFRQASENRLCITMIDRIAGQKKEALCLKNPGIERQCELVPIEIDVKDAAFARGDFLLNQKSCGEVRLIYVCFDDEPRALSAALLLRQTLPSKDIPIVMRMMHNSGLATLLQKEESIKGFSGLHAFGFLERTCKADIVLRGNYEILAKAIHEDYLSHEIPKGETAVPSYSSVPWSELPPEIKESNRRQAEHIRVKLDTVDSDMIIANDWEIKPFHFTDQEIEKLAEMEHERYVNEKIQAGWKFGERRDLKRKTNPTLVPWKDLPDEEREKDKNSVRILPALLARVGFQVYRLKGY